MKLIFSLVSYSLLTTSYSDVFSVTHNSFRVLFCSNPDWTQLVISDWFDLIICVSAFFEKTEIIIFVFTTWIVFNPTSRNQNEIRIFFFNFNILSAFERTCTQQKRRFCLISKQRISILEKESEWNRIKSETRNN